MRISDALRELFGSATQQAIAARLTAAGLPTDQTKVSAWLRGRVPNVEQLNAIEDCFGVPHGTVLAAAGFVDVQALASRGIGMAPSVRVLRSAAKGTRPAGGQPDVRRHRPEPPAEQGEHLE